MRSRRAAMASTVCSNFAVTRNSGSKAMNCSLPDWSTVSQLIGQRQDSGNGAHALWTMLFGQPLVEAVEILHHALQGKALVDEALATFGQAPAQRGITGQLEQARTQLLQVSGRNEEAGLTIEANF